MSNKVILIMLNIMYHIVIILFLSSILLTFGTWIFVFVFILMLTIEYFYKDKLVAFIQNILKERADE